MPPLRNDWAAYQFDQCVLFAGLTIENALREREKVGDQKNHEWRAKYTLEQLLDPEFRLPSPQTLRDERRNAGQMLRMLAGDGKSGVKQFREKVA